MKAEISQLLKATRKKLELPSSWTQHASARDAEHRSILALEPTAICWCLSGALQSAMSEINISNRAETRLGAEKIIGKVLEMDGCRTNIVRWNDNPWRRHHEVVQMLDRAVEKAESL